LSCLIVFIVICTKNFWKADMKQFHNNQITFSALNERHTTHNTSLLRESQTLKHF